MGRDTLTDKEQDWLSHVKACDMASISMKAYAERHGLDLQQFYVWKGRLRKLGLIAVKSKPVSQAFAQVCVAPRAKISGKTCIQLANGVKIEAPEDFNASALMALLTAAMALS